MLTPSELRVVVDAAMTASTPADDAGDPLALQAHVVKLRDRWERQKRLADEARAEADRLRVTLGKVGGAYASAMEDHDGDPCPVVDRVGKALSAADLVSLTDVRHELTRLGPLPFGGFVWACTCNATGTAPDEASAQDGFNSHDSEAVTDE